MWRAFCAVALVALASLAIRSARVGVAGDYVDPISKISAQDEALYSHSAIRMATSGDWLTPHFMGRYGLYKPPLSMWASGVSAKLLGISPFSLRLPTALLCALAVGFIFLWVAELATWQAGVAAAVLVMVNHLWHTMGSFAMTDGLLAAFFVAAMYALFTDPWLESRAGFWGFAGAVAAAILTKSVAGVLPVAVLAIYWIAAPRNYRPKLGRAVLAVAAATALAAPWFLYQLAVHGRWFWTEHVLVEILGFGAGAPPQTSQENTFLFYGIRLAWTDPFLVAFAAFGLPAFFSELRRRSPSAILLGAWILVAAGSSLGWQYRNASYLLPLVPALAVLAMAYAPPMNPKPALWLFLMAGVAAVVKLTTPLSPWGISYHAGTIQPAAPALVNYCEQGRGNELVIVNMVDDLYASVLPLPKLRYGAITKALAAGQYGMPFAEMGIILTTTQYLNLGITENTYRQKLHQWGLDSTEPVGTVILSGDEQELNTLIQAQPRTDFLLSGQVRTMPSSTHERVESGSFVLLLAKEQLPRTAPARWTCKM